MKKTILKKSEIIQMIKEEYKYVKSLLEEKEDIQRQLDGFVDTDNNQKINYQLSLNVETNTKGGFKNAIKDVFSKIEKGQLSGLEDSSDCNYAFDITINGIPNEANSGDDEINEILGVGIGASPKRGAGQREKYFKKRNLR